MATRIGDYVLSGELRNTRRNSIKGWIEFAPDYGVWIEIGGNFKGPFEGKTFRFRVNKPESEQIPIEQLPEAVSGLADRQIGVIGDVVFRKVKILPVPVEEFIHRTEMGEPAPCEIKECLYLEWFSQNGRIVAEIVDPEIEFLSNGDVTGTAGLAQPLPETDDDDRSSDGNASGLSITRIELGENEQAIIEDMSIDELQNTDDEYDLFNDDLDNHIRNSLSLQPDFESPDAANDQSNSVAQSDSGHQKLKSWDEVIPGIAPEIKSLYEKWDEIYGGTKDQPLAKLLDPAIRFPPPDSLQTDDDAEPHLRVILARLALFCVSIDQCEHCTPLSAYRLLVNEILPTAEVHPNLAGTNIVEHYPFYEYCSECDAEFQAEFEPFDPPDA